MGNRLRLFISIIFLINFLLFFPFLAFANDIELANQLYFKGDYDKAVEIYLKVIGQEGSSDIILFRLGICYLLSGKHNEAQLYLKKANKQNEFISKGKIYFVPSVGMAPTLLFGDYAIVEKDYYKKMPIKREDVIVIENPKKQGNLLIKRIIGLPGETIEIRQDTIFIAGEKLDDKFAVADNTNPYRTAHLKDYGPEAIPDDSYFVLGDNRDHSFDSRHFGFVPKQKIIGKVLGIYASIDSKKEPPVMRQERIGLIIK